MITASLADLISALLGEHLSGSESPLSDSKIATLTRTRSFVESNLHDPELSSNKVAEAMRMSTRYIQATAAMRWNITEAPYL
ncbi:hypothetical protein [Marinobacterium nitratireducens]|uniref:hypothetical protein n=1 Tax=Marinobacterium nitratireducens TaxID=518897 RepID=UPI00166D906A|nr:hypothetical protein [Marinobacterium nitratireducens]